MKSLITAVLFAVGASAAMAAPGNLQPGNADANLRSLIEQLGGGTDTSTSDLPQLLTSLLGLSGEGSADLEALVEQLAALDFQVLADEIAALLREQGFTARTVAERRAQNERLFVMAFTREGGAGAAGEATT